jgi:threonine dehydratase
VSDASDLVRLDAGLVRAVRADVERFARRSPIVDAPELAVEGIGGIGLKLESLQPTGSFKIRGAAAKIGGLDRSALASGVVTASTGNHGRAVAHVAAHLGATATVCLSDNVPPGKREALDALGATLDIGGPSQDAAFARAVEMAGRDDGPVLVHSILDPVTVAGQGTCGLEIAEQRPDCDLVLVPLSGGGLLAGITVAVRTRLPGVRVIGVSMDRGAAMHASLAAGHPVEVDEVDSLADSLQGGIGVPNDVTFPVVRDLVDDVVLVTEDEIAAALRWALVERHLVLEGAGAVGIAALRAGKVAGTARSTVVVCSGANVELETIAALATGTLGTAT